jgi:PAS domain S-box-containing protein
MRYLPEIRRLRAKLRRSNDPLGELQAYVRHLDVPVLVADDAARYVAANEAASALTCYSMDELLTLSVNDLTPAPHGVDVPNLWMDFVRAGTQEGEYEIRRRDGSIVQVAYEAHANVAPGLHVSFPIARRAMTSCVSSPVSF